jgi:hypothetical protein
MSVALNSHHGRPSTICFSQSANVSDAISRLQPTASASSGDCTLEDSIKHKRKEEVANEHGSHLRTILNCLEIANQTSRHATPLAV